MKSNAMTRKEDGKRCLNNNIIIINNNDSNAIPKSSWFSQVMEQMSWSTRPSPPDDRSNIIERCTYFTRTNHNNSNNNGPSQSDRGQQQSSFSLPAGVQEPLKGGDDDIDTERVETILVASRKTRLDTERISRGLTFLTMVSESDLQDVTTDGSSMNDSATKDDDDGVDSSKHQKSYNFSLWWSNVLKRYVHRPILFVLCRIARASAQYPIQTIVLVSFVSIVLLTVGVYTNFKLDLQPDLMWTPVRSYPIQHQLYIEDTFNTPPRRISLIFHANGDNILTRDMVRRAFPVLSSIQSHESYPQICANTNPTELLPPCILYGIPRFWNNNIDEYDAQVTNDQILHETIASDRFLDQLPVSHDDILGNILERNATQIQVAESFSVIFQFPDSELARAAETEMVQNVLQFRDEHGSFHVEAVAEDSITQELTRALYQDLPLVPLIFLAMSLYTAFVFARWHKVYSRSFLGFSAVIAVVFSITSGFGLLFIIGVPFTPITQLLPFLLFSLGLDNCFIIMGSYVRTDPRQSAVDRMHATLMDIGLSVTLTTLTTVIAFGLGCFSAIPAIYWLCQYCAPTIIFVFFYQITFFVACVSLDEQRIHHGRYDVLCCLRDAASADVSKMPLGHIADNVMEWYATQLLRPSVRMIVMFGFVALYAILCFGTSQMTQKFSIAEVLPRDSFVGDYLFATSNYRNADIRTIQVVFRDVDQGNPFVRQAMVEYTKQLGELSFVLEPEPESFWMTQFELFLQGNTAAAQLPFVDAMDRFLQNPFTKAVVGNNIVRNAEGEIIASRVNMKIDVSENVHEQILFRNTERLLTLSQPMNLQRTDRLAFFTFAKAYTGFENYSRGVNDLISTAVSGVIAVTFVALIFIPHWSAALVVGPLIVVLFIELLGFLHWGGLFLNSMTSMSMTISIGLLVDFVIHILFRYYEEPGSRQQKTVAMLRTMGSSVLLGGTTTLLGTLPLVFASSDALEIVFVSFLGIVLLGIGHGLVLVPVLLATYGPEDSVAITKPVVLVDGR